MVEQLIEYYNKDKEDTRLFSDNVHKLEYITTMAYLEKVLKPNSSILDACAGTGVYAFPLAKKEHLVTAVDLVPFNVKHIERKQCDTPVLKDIFTGNIMDMSRFENEKFEVVLCLGALYHLMELKERQKAIKECLRVLKPNGIIVVAYVNRHAQLLSGIVKNGIDDLDDSLEGIDTGKSKYFYRATPNEIESLMNENDTQKIYNIGTDGISYAIPKVINALDENTFEKWTRYHLSSAEDINLLGYSLHGLYIGQKK